MRVKLTVAWAAVVLALGTPAIAAAGATKHRSGASTCSGAYVIAKDAASLAVARSAVRCLVNAERAARGLRALRTSGRLENAATRHSADMISSKVLSHTGSDGSSVFERVARAGYRWRAAAEALAFGASRRSMPFRLVASLMRSPTHRSILLGRTYRDLGVGLALGAPTRRAAGAASTLTLDFASS